MLNEPGAMLRVLFAIPPARIDRDVAEGEREFDRLLEDTHAYYLANAGSEDPKKAAQLHHKELVRAKVMANQEDLREEYKLYYAAAAADRIAEEAVSVAHEQGRLAELSRRMEDIQKRGGLQDGECWPIGKGPEDYQELSKESEQLYKKVRDTVFTAVLRRYRLEEIADLYENDRARFDKLTERARNGIFARTPER